MRIQTAIDIEADAEVVWQHLIDVEHYPEWNPLTYRVEGTLEVGQPVVLRVRLGGRTLKRTHRVSRVDVERRELGWTIIDGHRWRSHGERVQRVEHLGEGRCRYTNDEQVHGLMGLVTGLMLRGTLTRALERVGEALKRRAESVG